MFCGVNILIGKSHLHFRIELVTILFQFQKNPVNLTVCWPKARWSMGQRTSWDVTGGQSQVAGMKHVVINSQTPSFPAGYCLVYSRLEWTTTVGSVGDRGICGEIEIEIELRSDKDVIAFKKNRGVVRKVATVCILLWCGSDLTFIPAVVGSRVLLWQEFLSFRSMPQWGTKSTLPGTFYSRKSI